MLQGVSPQDLRQSLEGSKFLSTARHGRYLFMQLAAGRRLLLHFGTTGKVEYLKKATQVPDHTRLLIRFTNGSHLTGVWQTRLGRIELVDDPASFVRIHRSFIVNLDFVGEISSREGGDYHVVLHDGTRLRLGRKYRDDLLSRA